MRGGKKDTGASIAWKHEMEGKKRDEECRKKVGNWKKKRGGGRWGRCGVGASVSQDGRSEHGEVVGGGNQEEGEARCVDVGKKRKEKD